MRSNKEKQKTKTSIVVEKSNQAIIKPTRATNGKEIKNGNQALGNIQDQSVTRPAPSASKWRAISESLLLLLCVSNLLQQ